MRLHPGLVRAVVTPSLRTSPLLRTAVQPGRWTQPWRPPVRLVGLLERMSRPTPATA